MHISPTLHLSEIQNNINETNFSALPNEAREELFEFYRSLLKKYNVSKLSNLDAEREDFLHGILPKPVKKFR
jgi:hypothetical protein